MMNRQLILTEDGTPSLYAEELGEFYHSKHGAIQESRHVYIQACLARLESSSISLFEVGFGTGLNAWLAYQYTLENNCSINYHSIELYPLESLEYIASHNQLSHLDEDHILLKMHEANWNEAVAISNNFKLHKIKGSLPDFQYDFSFDGCFFDAFSPSSQPEMWTNDIFEKIFQKMKPGGILTTYCAQGNVRRNLMKVGFSVERLPGPPGKREILRATKLNEL